MAQNHKDMMILTVEKRRDYFRKVYMAELARLHAAGKCMWPIEKLGAMVDDSMKNFLAKRTPIGLAYDATMKFFMLKTKKELFAFLGV